MNKLDQIKQRIKARDTHSKAQVFNLVADVQHYYVNKMQEDGGVVIVGKVFRPSKLRKYDIITSMVCGVAHPCIVYKVTHDYVYAVCLSSTDAAHNVFKLENSRFFTGSYVTNTIVRVSCENAMDTFIGVMDDKKEIDKGFALVRRLYKEVFKF